jgi:hypothetical protein
MSEEIRAEIHLGGNWFGVGRVGNSRLWSRVGSFGQIIDSSDSEAFTEYQKCSKTSPTHQVLSPLPISSSEPKKYYQRKRREVAGRSSYRRRNDAKLRGSYSPRRRRLN